MTTTEKNDADSVAVNQQIQAKQSETKNETSNSSLIDAALKFMRDPKVADAPMTKKIAFLESKGLSAEDIQHVMKLMYSNSSQQQPEIPPANYFQQSPAMPNLHQQQQQQILKSASRSRWTESVVSSVVVSSAALALYHLIQTRFHEYLPAWMQLNGGHLLQKQQTSEQQLKAEDERMSQLVDAAFQKHSERLMKAIEECESAVKLQVSESSLEYEMKAASDRLMDIHTDVRSLKSLMLSRKSFPELKGNSAGISHQQSLPQSHQQFDKTQTKPGDLKLPKWQIDPADERDDDVLAVVKEGTEDPLKNSLAMVEE